MTLKEYLHDGPLPPDAAYDVSIQVARGLNAVHELGIVHRDFKTANIMIDEAGVAKLVDFGIAKEVSADLTDPAAAGMIMCTPEYMSPEQVHGRAGQLPQRHLRAGVRRLRGVHRPRPVRRGDADGHLPDAPARRRPARRRGREAHPACPRPRPASARWPRTRTALQDGLGLRAGDERGRRGGRVHRRRPSGRLAPAIRRPASGRRTSTRAGDPATRRAAPVAMGAGRGARSRWPSVARGRACSPCSVRRPSALPPPASMVSPAATPFAAPVAPKRSTRSIVTSPGLAPAGFTRARVPLPTPSVPPTPTVAAAASGRRSPASFACWWCRNRGSSSTALHSGSSRAASCRWLPGPTPCASSTPTTSRCSAG